MKLKTIKKGKEIEEIKNDRMKTCFICKLGIDSLKDDFVEIAEYSQGNYFKSLWAHKICWLNHMSNKGMLNKTTMGLNKLLEKIS